MPKYKSILSIDGGGIRGIIPGQILVTLEHKLKKKSGNKNAHIADYFDLIAGTSTGGILACAYLCPAKPGDTYPCFSAEEVVNLYFERGKEIFSVPLFHKLKSLNGLLEEKYPSAGLDKALLDYFQEVTLHQLLKPSLITAYDIERRKTHFFKQQSAFKPYRNFFVKDLARATAAAPTYFETAKVKSLDKEDHCLIDGGVFANNPALCAYAEARCLFSKSKDSNKNASAIDMAILSLGTGKPKQPYDQEKTRLWSPGQWTKPIMDIMMAGVSETVDYQLMQIFDSVEALNQYLRINPQLPPNVGPEFDNASDENVIALKKLGEDTAKEYDQELDNFAELLLIK